MGMILIPDWTSKLCTYINGRRHPCAPAANGYEKAMAPLSG